MTSEAVCLFTVYKSFFQEIFALAKSGKIRKTGFGEQKNPGTQTSILRKR